MFQRRTIMMMMKKKSKTNNIHNYIINNNVEKRRMFSLNSNNEYIVSEEQKQAFHENGYITLTNVLTEEEMIELEQVYDEFNNGERNSNIDFGKDIGDMSQGQDTAREDFNMINIHVPADQIIDTVHLFHLPGQRMIGLAFLVKHLLGAGIQDSSQGHDSIEDAHGALLLYKKYRELKMNGKLDEVLKKLYEIGHKNQWK